jgi:hypothetical protein
MLGEASLRTQRPKDRCSARASRFLQRVARFRFVQRPLFKNRANVRLGYQFAIFMEFVVRRLAPIPDETLTRVLLIVDHLRRRFGRFKLRLAEQQGVAYAKTVTDAMNLKLDMDNPADREKLRRAVLDLVAGRKMPKQKGHG